MRHFCENAKNEMLLFPMRSRRSETAFLSAIIHTIGSLVISSKKRALAIRTDNFGIKSAIDNILQSIYGRESVYDEFEGNILLDGDYVEKLMFDCRIMIVGDDGELHYNAGIDTDILTDSQAVASYLRGMFLGAGSMSVIKGYHLEFAFTNSILAEDCEMLLNSLELKAKTIERKEKAVVYIKDAEVISDVLAMLGSTKAVLKLADISAKRSVNKIANSRMNCDIANIDKIVTLSQKQIEAIELLKSRNLFDSLDDKLKEVATMREQNPSDSLTVLAQKIGITKSGLRHRLDKILALVQKT